MGRHGSHGLSVDRALLTGLLPLESLATSSFLPACCLSAAESITVCLDLKSVGQAFIG